MARKTKEKEDAKLSGRARRKAEEAEARKKRLYYIVGGVAAVVALVVVAYFVRERNQEDPLPDIVAAPAAEIDAPVDGRLAGNPDAPVTLVEWGDYQ